MRAKRLGPSLRWNSRSECAFYTCATDDGGVLVLDGLEPPTEEATSARRGGTLDGELAAFEWVGEAIAAGITFEVLRSFCAELINRGWKQGRREPSVETISAALTEYLSSVGYLEIRLTEVRRVGNQGWSIAGTADGAPVRGRADPLGQLLHVRVD